MKYWIDKAIIATQKYAGINNWISFSDILTNIFSTDTTVLPAATVTVSGIVELATTAEVATGTDTTRAVTPASMAKYVTNIASGSWVVSGLNATYSVTGATHGKGVNPVVTLLKKNGTSYESTLSYTYSYVAANGNVTITILAADAADSRVIIN